MAHFVPTKYIELEWTPLDVKIFSFPKGIRYNQLTVDVPPVSGVLENKTVKYMIIIAGQNWG